MQSLMQMHTPLRRWLLALMLTAPLVVHAQTEPVIVEAESGALGSSLATATQGDATYITTTLNGTTPPTADRIATYEVTFPAAGDYELYARYRVGPGGGNDDSWYFGQGFGLKTPADGAQWALQNVGNTGYTDPPRTVYNGGGAGFEVFKWVKISGPAGLGQGPVVWTVPAGALRQTFQFGSREDGMWMDKFAFGRAGSYYTVNDLNTGGPATGVAPPPLPPDPPAYTRTGSPLGTGHEPKFLGSAHSGGNSLNFGAYWNQVTPENGGKWGTVEATRDTYDWAQARAAYQQARANGQTFKWHVLFWGNQQPAWMESLTTAEQIEEIHEWLAAIAAEFPDLEQIEVVNEPLHDPPRGATNGNYIEALGGDNGIYGTGWDWIIRSFELARQYFPNAKLMLNDYSITNTDSDTGRYIQIINLLKARNLIDLIGIQGHAFSTTGPMSQHTANIARLAETGLPIYVTELDIDGVDVNGFQDDARQLAEYQRIFPTFWENPAIKGITMWGYVRGGHWRTNQGAWLMYPNGAERPALQWLVRYMENELAVVAPQSFSVAENSADGTAVGTVVAADVDAGTTFSAWQIDGGSGASVFAIDATSGAISVVNSTALDFETTTSYTLNVSVFDGYRRSVPTTVTINVTNVNEHAPVVTSGQTLAIDGGVRNVLGKIAATDADDTNEGGFTTFQNWQIVGGTGASLFSIDPTTGALIAARPTKIDFRKSSYTVITQVSDGEKTSQPRTVSINIPNQIDLCVVVVEVEVPKSLVPLALKLGAQLGDCRAR